MWDNGGGLESFQQDARSQAMVTWTAMILQHVKCGVEGIGTILINAIGRGAITLWDCWMAVPAFCHLKWAAVLMNISFHSRWDSATFVGSSLFDIFPNCGSVRGGYLECSTKWILKIWRRLTMAIWKAITISWGHFTAENNKSSNVLHIIPWSQGQEDGGLSHRPWHMHI